MQDNNYFIQGILNSDEKVITEIYTLFFPKALNFVLQNKGQRVDAEDIFQKVLLQISVRIRNRELEVIHSTFEGYLFTACKNLWRRELNKQKNRVTNDRVVELASEESDMAYALLEQERWELFREKLNQLSDNCKQILALFLKKVSYADMVIQLSYSSETVARQRVFKCKAKLISMVKADNRFKKMIS
ncbi:sigma-70 family RNA polymerase sigma factor [Aquimarina sp. 2201CG5-10]|uniref:RNA polymerase sigma factor n=1 Tax=Aquimarina callyspongiae TaxID=3098150 RepID=UPI002AB5C23A|nr:sigma-70 family RNA polymerase sigma factor [Aquimarina sp. 2201CG5-10]MDY8138618.1 sigma-70 family RNA polymerase sigma factor [Aquimarina sp. 2201CG5-10]